MNNNNRDEYSAPPGAKNNGVSERTDRATQNRAIAVVVIIIALLFIYSAIQTGLLRVPGCAPSETALAPQSVDSAQNNDTVSAGDTSSADAALSDSDPAPDQVIVYYPDVHIEGINLPEMYGNGLFDADAAMWLINEYRRQNGLHELSTGDHLLADVADLRLSEIGEFFSHDRPDGSRFHTAYGQCGVNYIRCAENLAKGQFTAEQVVLEWINSDSHRANLLSADVTRMWVSVENLGENGALWVFEACS